MATVVYERYGFSEIFQRKVIACLVRNPNRFDVHADLIRPEFFTTHAAFDTVWHAREYRDKYDHWPDFTMLAEYTNAKLSKVNADKAAQACAFIDDLATLDTADEDAVFDRVRDFARERKIYRAIRAAHTALMEGREVEGGLIPLFEDALSIGEVGEDAGVILNRDWEKIVDAYGVTRRGIPCGRYPAFNTVWRNGWEPGWLVVPLAPPKRFKTTFALNLAAGIAGFHGERHDVIYYACEISQELAALRAICGLSNFSMNELVEHRESLKEAARGSIGAMMGNLMFKSFASKRASISTIRSHAKNAIKAHGMRPKAIVIDYAETVRADGAEDLSEWRASAEVYTQARALGNELGCVVIMPDRCKAEFVEKPVPSMRAFQGSFEKAGIVDIAIGLCQTEVEHVQNRMRYFVFLNRHGRECVHFDGVVDPERFRMTVDNEIPYQPDDSDSDRPGVAGTGRQKPKKRSEEAAALADEQQAAAAHAATKAARPAAPRNALTSRSSKSHPE